MATRQKNSLTTTADLRAIATGTTISESFGRGAGAFIIRSLSGGGIAFYFRHVTNDGKRDTYPIGRYHPAGTQGLTLKQGRDMARELSLMYTSGIKDIRKHFERVESDRLAAEEAEQLRKEEEERQRSSGLLRDLCEAYIETLQNDETCRNVTSIFNKHIKERFPRLWSSKANRLVKSDVRNIMAALNDEGKGRTANKLRSYLLSAFNKALQADDDPSIDAAKFSNFDININPVTPIRPIRGAERTRDGGLDDSQLREYWDAIVSREDEAGLMLQLHLLTGAQRVKQILRLTRDDILRSENTLMIRIYDPKGRRMQPRAHHIPLPSAAAVALNKLLELNSHGEYVMSNTGGLKPTRYELLNDEVKRLTGGTSIGLLRQTIETWLASRGISKEHRAQLQSHGLGGVQDRHYDRHHYAPEKLAALTLLEDWLHQRESAAVVVPIRAILA